VTADGCDVLSLQQLSDGAELAARSDRAACHAQVGFGRTVASETKLPNMFFDLVWRGWAVMQRDNATEPCAQGGPVDPAAAVWIGFGRIVASETEVPIILVNLV
jgi:hypothetical protein